MLTAKAVTKVKITRKTVTKGMGVSTGFYKGDSFKHAGSRVAYFLYSVEIEKIIIPATFLQIELNYQLTI